MKKTLKLYSFKAEVLRLIECLIGDCSTEQPAYIFTEKLEAEAAVENDFDKVPKIKPLKITIEF